MQQYFSNLYDGPPFQLFASGHLVSLGIVIGVIVFPVRGWKTHDENSRQKARLWFAGTILIVETSWHAWHLVHGSWEIQRRVRSYEEPGRP